MMINLIGLAKDKCPEVAKSQFRTRCASDTGSRWREPSLLVMALKRLDNFEVSSTIYFQEELKQIPPFTNQDFKTLKATKKNVPCGLHFEQGSLAVFHEGTFIGIVTPYAVEKHGVKSAKVYNGYVMPPCDDFYEGFTINDSYSVYLFK